MASRKCNIFDVWTKHIERFRTNIIVIEQEIYAENVVKKGRHYLKSINEIVT